MAEETARKNGYKEVTDMWEVLAMICVCIIGGTND